MEKTTKDRLLEYLAYSGKGQTVFEKEAGISNGYINNLKGSIGPKIMNKIIAHCLDLNASWLLTGEGNMLKDGEPPHPYTVNQNGKGVPYYDVDFIGGFDFAENDQSVTPAYYIDFPQYAKADSWINATGHSMEPLINHGDMIAIREVEDWRTYLLYGEIYAVVTDEYRTIKYVRKSARGDGYLRLVPANTEYDEQDIPTSIIRNIFQILGCAKKIF